MRITGKVTDFEGTPMEGVHVSLFPLIQTILPKGTITNSFGAFAVEANFGDKLVFSHVSAPNDKVEVLINGAGPFNVQLLTGYELDGVDVTGKKRRSNWLWWLLLAGGVGYVAFKNKDKIKTVKV